MVSTMLPYLILLSGLATPILSFPGATYPQPVVQAIVPRASWIGGWPLALDGSGGDCPDIAPVGCGGGSSSLNTQCCPSGTTCNAKNLITAYCCPSDNDCKTSVTNFPACANTTWIMYTFNYGFFCCEEGTIAVNPITGYDGLCVPSDQAVPKSLLASAATQVGGGALPTGSSSDPTETDSSTAATTTPAGSSQTSSSSSNNNNNSSKSNNSLGIGPIIGIVIGGIGLILLAGIFYALMRRRRPAPATQPEIVYMPAPGGATELPPTVGRKPVPHTMATSVYSAAPPRESSPGNFNASYYGEGEQRYDPPLGEPPAPSRTPQPYESYAEMEGRNIVNRAELRADRSIT